MADRQRDSGEDTAGGGGLDHIGAVGDTPGGNDIDLPSLSGLLSTPTTSSASHSLTPPGAVSMGMPNQWLPSSLVGGTGTWGAVASDLPLGSGSAATNSWATAEQSNQAGAEQARPNSHTYNPVPQRAGLASPNDEPTMAIRSASNPDMPASQGSVPTVQPSSSSRGASRHSPTEIRSPYASNVRAANSEPPPPGLNREGRSYSATLSLGDAKTEDLGDEATHARRHSDATGSAATGPIGTSPGSNATTAITTESGRAEDSGKPKRPNTNNDNNNNNTSRREEGQGRSRRRGRRATSGSKSAELNTRGHRSTTAPETDRKDTNDRPGTATPTDPRPTSEHSSMTLGGTGKPTSGNSASAESAGHDGSSPIEEASVDVPDGVLADVDGVIRVLDASKLRFFSRELLRAFAQSLATIAAPEGVLDELVTMVSARRLDDERVSFDLTAMVRKATLKRMQRLGGQSHGMQFYDEARTAVRVNHEAVHEDCAEPADVIERSKCLVETLAESVNISAKRKIPSEPWSQRNCRIFVDFRGLNRVVDGCVTDLVEQVVLKRIDQLCLLICEEIVRAYHSAQLESKGAPTSSASSSASSTSSSSASSSGNGNDASTRTASPTGTAARGKSIKAESSTQAAKTVNATVVRQAAATPAIGGRSGKEERLRVILDLFEPAAAYLEANRPSHLRQLIPNRSRSPQLSTASTKGHDREILAEHPEVQKHELQSRDDDGESRLEHEDVRGHRKQSTAPSNGDQHEGDRVPSARQYNHRFPPQPQRDNHRSHQNTQQQSQQQQQQQQQQLQQPMWQRASGDTAGRAATPSSNCETVTTGVAAEEELASGSTASAGSGTFVIAPRLTDCRGGFFEPPHFQDMLAQQPLLNVFPSLVLQHLAVETQQQVTVQQVARRLCITLGTTQALALTTSGVAMSVERQKDSTGSPHGLCGEIIRQTTMDVAATAFELFMAAPLVKALCETLMLLSAHAERDGTNPESSVWQVNRLSLRSPVAQALEPKLVLQRFGALLPEASVTPGKENESTRQHLQQSVEQLLSSAYLVAAHSYIRRNLRVLMTYVHETLRGHESTLQQLQWRYCTRWNIELPDDDASDDELELDEDEHEETAAAMEAAGCSPEPAARDVPPVSEAGRQTTVQGPPDNHSRPGRGDPDSGRRATNSEHPPLRREHGDQSFELHDRIELMNADLTSFVLRTSNGGTTSPVPSTQADSALASLAERALDVPLSPPYLHEAIRGLLTCNAIPKRLLMRSLVDVHVVQFALALHQPTAYLPESLRVEIATYVSDSLSIEALVRNIVQRSTNPINTLRAVANHNNRWLCAFGLLQWSVWKLVTGFSRSSLMKAIMSCAWTAAISPTTAQQERLTFPMVPKEWYGVPPRTQTSIVDSQSVPPSWTQQVNAEPGNAALPCPLWPFVTLSCMVTKFVRPALDAAGGHAPADGGASTQPGSTGIGGSAAAGAGAPSGMPGGASLSDMSVGRGAANLQLDEGAFLRSVQQSIAFAVLDVLAPWLPALARVLVVALHDVLLHGLTPRSADDAAQDDEQKAMHRHDPPPPNLDQVSDGVCQRMREQLVYSLQEWRQQCGDSNAGASRSSLRLPPRSAHLRSVVGWQDEEEGNAFSTSSTAWPARLTDHEQDRKFELLARLVGMLGPQQPLQDLASLPVSDKHVLVFTSNQHVTAFMDRVDGFLRENGSGSSMQGKYTELLQYCRPRAFSESPELTTALVNELEADRVTTSVTNSTLPRKHIAPGDKRERGDGSVFIRQDSAQTEYAYQHDHELLESEHNKQHMDVAGMDFARRGLPDPRRHSLDSCPSYEHQHASPSEMQQQQQRRQHPHQRDEDAGDARRAGTAFDRRSSTMDLATNSNLGHSSHQHHQRLQQPPQPPMPPPPPSGPPKQIHTSPHSQHQQQLQQQQNRGHHQMPYQTGGVPGHLHADGLPGQEPFVHQPKPHNPAQQGQHQLHHYSPQQYHRTAQPHQYAHHMTSYAEDPGIGYPPQQLPQESQSQQPYHSPYGESSPSTGFLYSSPERYPQGAPGQQEPRRRTRGRRSRRRHKGQSPPQPPRGYPPSPQPSQRHPHQQHQHAQLVAQQGHYFLPSQHPQQQGGVQGFQEKLGVGDKKLVVHMSSGHSLQADESTPTASMSAEMMRSLSSRSFEDHHRGGTDHGLAPGLERQPSPNHVHEVRGSTGGSGGGGGGLLRHGAEPSVGQRLWHQQSSSTASISTLQSFSSRQLSVEEFDDASPHGTQYNRDLRRGSTTDNMLGHGGGGIAQHAANAQAIVMAQAGGLQPPQQQQHYSLYEHDLSPTQKAPRPGTAPSPHDGYYSGTPPKAPQSNARYC